MEKKYMVITEIRTDNGMERWYYGTYADSNRANEVALAEGCDRVEGYWHCVIPADEAEAFHVKNLPY